MRCDSWVWSFAADYPGPAGNDDSHLPINRVTLKTHERSVWFSQEQISGFAHIYREQGIELSAWCVPVGAGVPDAANAIAVLGMLKTAGIAEPWLQFDFEKEPGNFWLGTADEVWRLFTDVKAACPWAHLSICLYQFDPALGFINVGSHPACERFVSMAYWDDFGETPEACLSRFQKALAPYGKPVQHGIPGNTTPEKMQRGLQWIKDYGDPVEPIVWRRGTTSRAVWETIAGFDMTPPGPPQPPPDDRERAILAEMVLRDEQDQMRALVRLEADTKRLADAGGKP